MSTNDIVEQLARERRVEQMICHICKADGPNLDDLAQMIYEALLLYDEKKITALWEAGQMNFFLVRIIKNQYFSSTSPYHTTYRKRRGGAIEEWRDYEDESSY